ncbi:MAG: ISL3 family transposase [Sutterella sp.]|nr:ISL3 family transposase [Sutterella sp.]
MASTHTLFTRLINVKNSVITDLTITDTVTGTPTLEVEIRPYKRLQCLCPECGRKCPKYDQACRTPRRWRATDFASVKVFLRYAPPRIECPEHGVLTASVPWADPGSGFTRDFDMTVTWMAMNMNKSAVAELMRIDWATVGRCISRVRQLLEPDPAVRFANLRHIGVDETSYRKGHKYITVVINHDDGSIVWAHEGHGKAVFMKFLNELTQEQREGIEVVTGDGARWVDDGVEAMLPNCHRCVDSFHVVEWAMKALDDVRAGIWRELYKQAKQDAQASAQAPQSKRLKNKAQRSKEAASEVKGSKYAIGKDPGNLTKHQEEKLAVIRAWIPMRSRPLSPAAAMPAVFTAWSSWSMPAAIRSTKWRPASVNRTPRAWRSNRTMPRSSSSAFTRALTLDCATPSALAAWRKFRYSATARV